MADHEDKKQLKFIEILLVVGGIIGSLGIKSEDSSIRLILTLFLICSLMYYYMVSNQLYKKKLYRKVFANLTSILFAVLITSPLISSTPELISFWGSSYPIFNIITNCIMAVCLSILIFLNLQDKSEVEFGKSFNFLIIIIINSILILITFNWLTASS